MEQNVENLLMNILIYHACKREQHTQSYGMMNRGIKCYRYGDLAEIQPHGKVNGARESSLAGAGSPELSRKRAGLAGDG